jgi:hypothetical protein
MTQRMKPTVCDHNRHSAYLVIHWKQRYVGQRPINGLPAGLQEVLEPLVVLIRPREGEEVGVIDGPVEWLICGLSCLCCGCGDELFPAVSRGRRPNNCDEACLRCERKLSSRFLTSSVVVWRSAFTMEEYWRACGSVLAK